MSKSPIEMSLDRTVWKSVEPPTDNPENLPYAISEGELTIGTLTLKCVQLNTGERLITEESMLRFLEFMEWKNQA
jgi:hypothetical protein